MSTFARFGRWLDWPQQRWYVMLLDNLRSNLTWLDVLVGFSAIIVFSAVLIGFRYQVIPGYKIDQIADQDVRAIQDVTYEDIAATNQKRAAAESAVPSLYQFDSDLISDREKAIGAAFLSAREILANHSLTKKTALLPTLERDLLKELESKIGGTFPPNLIPVLLRQIFNPVLEGRILKILDGVLRDGIISDRGKFLKDQKAGILIRNGSFPYEHPLTDVYRDLPAAREYVRQFRLDFPDLQQRDQAILIQYLEDALFPTLIYSRHETESRRAQAALSVQPVVLQIRQGQTIIRSGEQVTPSILLELDALRKLQQPRSLILQLGGYFFLAAILVYSLWRYLVYYQTRHRKIRNHMTLILVIIASELLTMRIATALAEILGERFQRFHNPSVLYYGIPFAFGALLATLLTDVNLGIISSIILAVLTGLFYGDVDLAAYLIIGSFAGIYSIRQYRDRAAILKAGFTIGIVNLLCLGSLDILRQTPLNFADMLNQFVLALLSGALAAALASMLLPALEALFKIVTDIRLLELSNLNAPMLRRLSVEAPGTYHHSLMVATLAEAASESIGANSLLARVAAYYHDLGKLLKPEYFVENQPLDSNKHEGIPPSTSCAILASHVKDGMQLAKEIGLPQRISDMIPQHHGTRVMTYFYQKAKDSSQSGTGEIVEADFRYSGPKPQSKEAAIIMMADSVEAASRTLSDPTPLLVQGMIDRLVDDVARDNQLEECDITFRDVQRIKESFLKILTGIFHRRIEYPGYDFKQIGNDPKGSAAQNPGSEPTTTV
jgi:cyclic-di-AMP phosphodiesterase PgpH